MLIKQLTDAVELNKNKKLAENGVIIDGWIHFSKYQQSSIHVWNRMEFLTQYLFTPNIIARLTYICKYMKDILNIYANSLWISQANLAFSVSVELTSFLLWNMKDKN